MPRIRKARTILHSLNTDSKAHSWNELILAAQLELRRVEDRAMHLREAIEVFKKREHDGDPFIGSTVNEGLATQN